MALDCATCRLTDEVDRAIVAVLCEPDAVCMARRAAEEAVTLLGADVAALVQTGPPSDGPCRLLGAGGARELVTELLVAPGAASAGPLSPRLPVVVDSGAVGNGLALRVGRVAERRFDAAEARALERLARIVAHAHGLKSAEGSARAALADAVLAAQRKDEFLAVLGHELRNPLAPILTALELMRLRGEGGERERAIMQEHVRLIVRFADDLLDVSRMARGTLQLSPERVDVAAVLTQAVEHALPLLQQRGHRLAVDVEAGLHADADPMRLAQVVGNLLTNAARYTDRGGNVKLSAWAEAGALVITVADDGIGIPAHLQARIFEPFTQLDAGGVGRAPSGLGIGLALVRTLVLLHGGTVEVKSDGPGAGSVFTVRLPRRDPAAGASSASGRLHAAPRRVERVLIVDDNADGADTMAEALTELGYTVRVVYLGARAVPAFLELEAEVVLLDLGLPDVDGLEVARQLRAASGGEAAWLIALTGYGHDDDRRRTQAAGFDEHLVKPVDLRRLLALIERAPRVRPPPSS
jgi:signal transduction histidine kinase/ActR/RegA family two-component response regulator